VDITNPEMGMELKAGQLEPQTVVVIGHDTCRAYMTAWVVIVGGTFVVFKMGEVGAMFMAMRLPDDSLRDDSGKVIRVWQFIEGGNVH